MSWFQKLMPSRIRTEGTKKTGSVPEGLWEKCDSCAAVLYKPELERNLYVCPKCGHHMAIAARDRLDALFDPGSAQELDASLEPVDALHFRDSKAYTDRIRAARKQCGEKDALISMHGRLKGQSLTACAFEFRYMGGSMGSVVGERLTRLIETCTERSLPVIIISASGGARMYEGMFSLMQMAKTSAALAYLARAGLPYLSVLTHPTTAGVMASYASLGDLIIAEPGAMIGFAGPRVIKDTTQAELPPGFQTAEFLLEHGLVDAIVKRRELKERLALYLDYLSTGAGRRAA